MLNNVINNYIHQLQLHVISPTFHEILLVPWPPSYLPWPPPYIPWPPTCCCWKDLGLYIDSTALYYISLLSGLGNIDDQNRNPNIINRDHLVGQLTNFWPFSTFFFFEFWIFLFRIFFRSFWHQRIYATTLGSRDIVKVRFLWRSRRSRNRGF